MTTILNEVLKQISKVTKLDSGYASISKEELGQILVTNHTTIGRLADHVKAVSNHHVFFNKKLYRSGHVHA